MNSITHQSFLVVEDSEEDFTALRRAIKNSPMKGNMIRFEDGDAVLNFLREPGIKEIVLVFILLDLNLPGTDGKAVLKIIKKEERLRSIPVIVFTTSTDERDVNECYALGADSYMVKPMAYQELKKKMAILEQYWLNRTSLPRYI